MRPRRRFRRRLLRAAALFAPGATAFFVWVYAVPFPRERLLPERAAPARILDRTGAPLWEGLAADGSRRVFLPLSAISRSLVDATLAAEDHRFYSHPGVDVWAVLRAVKDDVASLRRVSGASTITMQLVRLLEPGPRTLFGKFHEAVQALRLERALTKDRILEEYLNRAPYGGNTAGAEAGARRTFGKSARDLSPAEAALLAALPQAPSFLDPRRFPERALTFEISLAEAARCSPRAAQVMSEVSLAEAARCSPRAAQVMSEVSLAEAARCSPRAAQVMSEVSLAEAARCSPRAARLRKRQLWILGEMRRLGTIDEETWRRALEEDLRFAAPGASRADILLVDWVRPTHGGDTRTTLDADLERVVEGLVLASRPHLLAAGASEAAVVVLDNATGDVLAAAGPVARRRSPGSTLKPFLYALALESGKAAATPCDDSPAHFATPGGDYAPRNYDGVFHGQVTLRQALANSLNVPAVRTLHEVGVAPFVARLRRLGLEGIDPDPARHGLGLVLGDARVSPLELAGAYATLARLGTFVLPHVREGAAAAIRVFMPAAAYVVADILSDDRARSLGFGVGTELCFESKVAAKTGTSADHRDNWVAGFTRDRTVVAWVGNADGTPLRGTSGLEGAGPLFRAVMERVAGPWLEAPSDVETLVVCRESGLLPGPACTDTFGEVFIRSQAPRETCRARDPGLRIVTPPVDARYAIDPEAPEATRFLGFVAECPPGAVVAWSLDGKPLGASLCGDSLKWPARPGTFRLTATVAGREESRRFTVREAP